VKNQKTKNNIDLTIDQRYRLSILYNKLSEFKAELIQFYQIPSTQRYVEVDDFYIHRINLDADDDYLNSDITDTIDMSPDKYSSNIRDMYDYVDELQLTMYVTDVKNIFDNSMPSLNSFKILLGMNSIIIKLSNYYKEFNIHKLQYV